MSLNAFSPYARAASLTLADEPPVPHQGALYYEILHSDLWLVADGQRFFVSDTNGNVLSERYWNPAYAVQRAVTLRCQELAGWLFV